MIMTTVFDKLFSVADQTQQKLAQGQSRQSNAGAWQQHMEQEQIATWLRLGVTEHNLKLTSHHIDVQEARILSSDTMVKLDQMRMADVVGAERTLTAPDQVYSEQDENNPEAQHERQASASQQVPIPTNVGKSATILSGQTRSAEIGDLPESDLSLAMATVSTLKSTETVRSTLTSIPQGEGTIHPIIQQSNGDTAIGRETLESAVSMKSRAIVNTRIALNMTSPIPNFPDEEITTSEVTETDSVNQTEHGKLNFHVEKDGTGINLWIGSAPGDAKVVAMLIERLLNWANSQHVAIKKMIWNGNSYEQEQWADLLRECKKSSQPDRQADAHVGLMKHGTALTTITNRILNYGN